MARRRSDGNESNASRDRTPRKSQKSRLIGEVGLKVDQSNNRKIRRRSARQKRADADGCSRKPHLNLFRSSGRLRVSLPDPLVAMTAGAVLLGFAIRTTVGADAPLWLDETFTGAIAAQPSLVERRPPDPSGCQRSHLLPAGACLVAAFHPVEPVASVSRAGIRIDRTAAVPDPHLRNRMPHASTLVFADSAVDSRVSIFAGGALLFPVALSRGWRHDCFRQTNRRAEFEASLNLGTSRLSVHSDPLLRADPGRLSGSRLCRPPPGPRPAKLAGGARFSSRLCLALRP